MWHTLDTFIFKMVKQSSHKTVIIVIFDAASFAGLKTCPLCLSKLLCISNIQKTFKVLLPCEQSELFSLFTERMTVAESTWCDSRRICFMMNQLVPKLGHIWALPLGLSFSVLPTEGPSLWALPLEDPCFPWHVWRGMAVLPPLVQMEHTCTQHIPYYLGIK